MEDIEDNPPDNWGSRSAGTTSHFFCHGGILPPSRLNYNFLVHTYGKAHKKELFPGFDPLDWDKDFCAYSAIKHVYWITNYVNLYKATKVRKVLV